MIEYLISIVLFGWVNYIFFLGYSSNPIIIESKVKDKKNCWKLKCERCLTYGYQKKSYFHGFELNHDLWVCDSCINDA